MAECGAAGWRTGRSVDGADDGQLSRGRGARRYEYEMSDARYGGGLGLSWCSAQVRAAGLALVGGLQKARAETCMVHAEGPERNQLSSARRTGAWRRWKRRRGEYERSGASQRRRRLGSSAVTACTADAGCEALG